MCLTCVLELLALSMLCIDIQVKLSDFGMARVLDDHSEVYNLSNLGARIPVAWSAFISMHALCIHVTE